MKALAPAVVTALAADTLTPRDFLWFTARNRDTGAAVSEGYWSDLGTVSAEVMDPATGNPVTRTYFGAGDLIGMGTVALVTGLTVQTVSIRMSQVSDRVAQLVRGYDLRRARVQVHRGFLDPRSRLLVSPAVMRFEGFVDELVIETPTEGAEGDVVLTVASEVQELTRSNAATRSDADQRLRHPDDGFFQHVAAISNWQIKWSE